MKLIKLIEGDGPDRRRLLQGNFSKGINSLEQAKEYFSNYLTIIQRTDGTEELASLDDFEQGIDNAIDKDDIVSALHTLDELLLTLKSSGAEKYIPLKDFEKPLKDFEKRMDKNKYVKV